MKILLNSIILISLLSCASNKNKKNIKLDDVTSEDFKKTEVVKYSDSSDQFAKVDMKETEALNEESIQRLEDPSDVDTKTVLDEIIVNCYEKDFKKAFELIEANHDQYRQHPIFWNQVGTCFMLQGKRRKALLFYNKALEFKASYSPAFNNLGVMYRNENSDQKALVAFTRSKKANNLSKTPRFNLGNLYLEYGLYNHAIAMFKGLYNVAPNDVDVLAALGTAYLMKNEIKNSISYFKKIDDDFWVRPNVGINYAYATYLDNEKDKAKEILSEVNPKKLDDWENYYNQIKNKVGVK
jgi:tetratricopeptide (TPR) repeat protein